MRQTKFMLAFLAILALASTVVRSFRRVTTLTKGSAPSEIRTTKTPCRFSRKP